MQNSASLKRALPLPIVIFYGLGTILGAGIYVLVGKITALAGFYAPFAFLLASFIAFFTAISYAELGSRFPKSAGEAFYVQKAFQKKWLSALVGWLVVFTGVVSAAAITRGFVGYLHLFVIIPSWLAILLLVLIMGGIAIWGINESAILITLITLIEIGGLLLILFLARDNVKQLPDFWQQLSPLTIQNLPGIFSGAFLAFYAFIGFEDMVNIAEEIKNPERNLPYAIFISLGIATLLYFFVALAMLLALPLQELAHSEAPLAVFFEKKGYSPALIGLISLIAIINGAFVQIIMASRVIYGMAKQQTAPELFSHINRRTQTPVAATLLVVAIVLTLALWLKVESLAKMTSAVILCVFIMINLTLVILKLKKETRKEGRYPIFFPITGFVLSLLFLLAQIIS
ncbi:MULTISPECIES: APC family permease [unclassified Legionella]|uniref:APC family permease n=1 Tax=unclassified Legionella TaxID=2622702 RepID=UPI0010562937|nr:MULTISPECIES: amino acid permease [unclassified Legionella]MDI9819247.1 amino acid permease [Legionella sp. PL877]